MRTILTDVCKNLGITLPDDVNHIQAYEIWGNFITWLYNKYKISPTYFSKCLWKTSFYTFEKCPNDAIVDAAIAVEHIICWGTYTNTQQEQILAGNEKYCVNVAVQLRQAFIRILYSFFKTPRTNEERLREGDICRKLELLLK